jgi:D-isomer specific 2-hydroxyacid dehydrogenase, NAD binding domain
MKPMVVLVNTSHGPVIDEQALARALSQGQTFPRGLMCSSEAADPSRSARLRQRRAPPTSGISDGEDPPGHGRPSGRQPARGAGGPAAADPSQSVGPCPLVRDQEATKARRASRAIASGRPRSRTGSHGHSTVAARKCRVSICADQSTIDLSKLAVRGKVELPSFR